MARLHVILGEIDSPVRVIHEQLLFVAVVNTSTSFPFSTSKLFSSRRLRRIHSRRTYKNSIPTFLPLQYYFRCFCYRNYHLYYNIYPPMYCILTVAMLPRLLFTIYNLIRHQTDSRHRALFTGVGELHYLDCATIVESARARALLQPLRHISSVAITVLLAAAVAAEAAKLTTACC